MLNKVSLYADKTKYDALGFSAFAAPILIGMIADTVQAYNLIDVKDRACDLTIYDNSSEAILYPSK
ncbi:hypothetical protein SDC9_153385 [bioreactor metagenome]|uniref:Uncharacterized protein n=1 Tax=bioreactor metagenome TaxID=1076179 RepID=A0A645EXE0_9ZZZZ